MKNKRMLAALLAISLLQLIFPLVLIAYEGGFYSDVLEKGESYTLYYTHINSMNKGVMHTNIGNRYTVGYRWWGEDEDIRDSDTTDYYYKLCIENAEDGKVDFYETDKRELTDYNWFYRYNAFEVNFDDYEFVRDDFGMRELVETSILITEDETNDVTTFEKFMTTQDGYYNTLWHIPFEGKVTLKVYKGIAVVGEFYIGEELVMKHKALSD